jgi:hypothetical protein
MFQNGEEKRQKFALNTYIFHRNTCPEYRLLFSAIRRYEREKIWWSGEVNSLYGNGGLGLSL